MEACQRVAIVFVSTEIAADPALVARHARSVERFPDWSPFFGHVRRDGDCGYRLGLVVSSAFGLTLLGTSLHVRAEAPALDGIVLTGASIDPRWLSFRHELLVEPSPGGSRLAQTMRFTGLSQKLFPDSLMPPIRAGCVLLGESVRDRLERPSSAGFRSAPGG